MPLAPSLVEHLVARVRAARAEPTAQTTLAHRIEFLAAEVAAAATYEDYDVALAEARSLAAAVLAELP